MTVTDIVTLSLSLYLLLRGASRGFMQSLTVPFSIIVATIISVIYYKTTQNIIALLLIGLIGPFLLNLHLKFLIKMWSKTTSPEEKLTPISRLGGSILTLAWGWVFIVFLLILLTVLPPWRQELVIVKNDVQRSYSYVIARPIKEILFSITQQKAPPAANESFSKQAAQSLAQDPRFQKVLQDPEIQKEITAHDFAKLLSNPKMMDLVQQIMRDPATMKKILAIYKSQQEGPSTK